MGVTTAYRAISISLNDKSCYCYLSRSTKDSDQFAYGAYAGPEFCSCSGELSFTTNQVSPQVNVRVLRSRSVNVEGFGDGESPMWRNDLKPLKCFKILPSVFVVLEVPWVENLVLTLAPAILLAENLDEGFL